MADWAVTTAGTGLHFDTINNYHNACYSIDATHFINFWAGGPSNYDDGFVQVFAVDTATWAVTTANASLEFDTVMGICNTCYKIDTNHFINFWTGESRHLYTQVFTVNTTTWAVTTAGDRLEYDTGGYTSDFGQSCFGIDANHFINLWRSLSAHGQAQVFTVNTTTWAVTTAAGVFEYNTSQSADNSCYAIDANHFINFYMGSAASKGDVDVLVVDTATWAVTTATERFEFSAAQSYAHACYPIDSNHFINFWYGETSHGYTQVFTVNTATWAVTTAGGTLEFDTSLDNYNSCYKVDTNHFINFWMGPSNDGFTQTFTVNTSTWEITTAATSLEFDTAYGQWNACYKVDTNHFINFWQGSANADGWVQVFAVEIPATTPASSGIAASQMYYVRMRH